MVDVLVYLSVLLLRQIFDYNRRDNKMIVFYNMKTKTIENITNYFDIINAYST